MSEIYLFRHGQACFGTKNYDRLSPTGVRQSELLAKFLEGSDIHFDAVYAGRMNRHEETARPFCDRYGTRHCQLARPEFTAAFDEYDSRALLVARKRRQTNGEEERIRLADLMRDTKAFQAYFAETVTRWAEGEFDAMEGIEPYPLFCRRVMDGIDGIMERHGNGQRIAVFTSGGPISVAVKTALVLSDEKAIEVSWQIMNASLTCLKYSGQKLALSILNSVTHLWREKDPSLITYR